MRYLKIILQLRKNGMPLLRLLAEIGFFLKEKFRPVKPWVAEPYSYESDLRTSQQYKMAYFIHIHHPEYVRELKDFLGESTPADFFVTTSLQEVFDEVNTFRATFPNKLEVKLCINVGRNFGPLLVEYGDTIPKYDLVVHLHSKRSSHRAPNIGSVWARDGWNLFNPAKQHIAYILEAFARDPNLGLAYSVNLEVTPRRSFGWGNNFEEAKLLGVETDLPVERAKFLFPAGGMFLARSLALEPLILRKLSYSDFPPELGQLDGTAQHAIERLVGISATNQGYRHLLFDAKSELFTVQSPLSDGRQPKS